MTLVFSDLRQLTLLATSAALCAAKYIATRTGTLLELQSKSGGDSLASQVVTEVDVACEKIILDVLTPSLRLFDIAVLTEETPDDRSRLVKSHFWCIDPLDGTLAFSRGKSGYAVSIALVAHTGEPIIGVVANPVTGDLFSAIVAHGAQKNGEKLAIVPAVTRKPLTVVYDSHYVDSPAYATMQNCFIRIAAEAGFARVRTVTSGGAVLNALEVVQQGPACYAKTPKTSDGGGSLWDYAASALIVKEAGGWVSDIFGESLELNSKDSVYMNRKGILYASGPDLAKIIRREFSASKLSC